VKLAARQLGALAVLRPAAIREYETQIAEEIAKAVAEGKQAPWPDPRDLMRHVY
jgi:TPP-dependent pyruvate/acetoin dehydrogenase alpha subunit